MVFGYLYASYPTYSEKSPLLLVESRFQNIKWGGRRKITPFDVFPLPHL